MSILRIYPIKQGVAYDGRQPLGAPFLAMHDVLAAAGSDETLGKGLGKIEADSSGYAVGQFVGHWDAPDSVRSFRFTATQGNILIAFRMADPLGVFPDNPAAGFALSAEQQTQAYRLAEGATVDLTAIDPNFRGSSKDGVEQIARARILAFHTTE